MRFMRSMTAMLAYGAMLGACAGPGDGPIERETIEVGTDGIKKETVFGPMTLLVNAPLGVSWKVLFYDSSGAPIESGDGASGTGPGAVVIPAGTAIHTIVIGGAPVSSPSYEQATTSRLAAPSAAARGSDSYLVIEESIDIGDAGGLPAIAMRVLAPNAVMARSTARGTAELVGEAIPASVEVIAVIAGVVQDGSVLLESSLPERFDEFSISIDGTVVADAATGQAVTRTPAGAGWVTLSTLLPLSAAQPGSEVMLRQKGRTSEPFVGTIKFN